MSLLRIPTGKEGKEIAELEILLDGGPLAVAGVWDWLRKQRVAGLYAIYHKKTGIKLGPFYASVNKAHQDMKLLAKLVPLTFWDQPIEWLRRQKGVQDWIDKELGKPEDLIGGEWDES
jgi:hypothetical protein